MIIPFGNFIITPDVFSADRFGHAMEVNKVDKGVKMSDNLKVHI